MNLFERVEGSLRAIRLYTDFEPEIGIVLGTGLSDLADEVDIVCDLPFRDIPHMPMPTVVGHQGRMIFGYLGKIPIVLLAGRFHYYEGYSMEEVTFPIRLLGKLGIKGIIMSNVAGGLQADLEAGDLVFLRDHINLQPANPLRGKNDERLGPRFPDMMNTYHKEWNSKALAIAKASGYRAREGVYVALAGPNLETPAEYKFLNIIGGDVVGMSTIPEVLVAKHMGIKIFAVSIVSNKCFPIEDLTPTTVEEVIAVAKESSAKLKKIVLEILPEMTA